MKKLIKPLLFIFVIYFALVGVSGESRKAMNRHVDHKRGLRAIVRADGQVVSGAMDRLDRSSPAEFFAQIVNSSFIGGLL